MRAIHKGVLAISDALNWIAEKICILFIGIVVFVTLIAVFYRYILSLGLSWTEELCRALNVWCAFLGASICYKHGDHVGVEFVVNLLPKKFYHVLRFLLRIFTFYILAVFAALCYRYTMASTGQTAAMQITIGWTNAGLFVGFGLMLVHLAEFMLRDLVSFMDFVTGKNKNTIEGGTAQ